MECDWTIQPEYDYYSSDAVYFNGYCGGDIIYQYSGMFSKYPLISLARGNQFPQIVTHIMPCPIVSLSIAVFAGYERKNRLLLLLLTVWGLTGIKSVIFAAYEDAILLICGIYGVYLLAKEIQLSRLIKANSRK